MSINSAMLAGVAGLSSNGTALAIISDNIANVNTIGYKKNVADFSTLVTKTQSSGAFSAGGVRAFARALVDEQGLLQNTTSATDLGISGNGFFTVSPNSVNTSSTGRFLFTRAGSFSTDAQGFLQNSAGYYLQGWPVAADGTVTANPSDLTALESVNINQLGGTAESTNLVTLNANLLSSQPISAAEATYAAGVSGTNMASGAVAPDFQRSFQLFDSKGGFRTVTISLLKSSVPNQWNAELHVTPATDINAGAPFVDGQISTGILAFTADGLIDPAATTLPTNLNFLASGAAPGPGQFAWGTALGIDAQSVTLDLGQPGAAGGFTQFDSPSTLISTQVNGAVFGNLTGVRVDDQGFVVALFDNGIQRQIYQLPVATFVNPNGLSSEQGNAYVVTNESGAFNLKQPGTAGAGLIAAGALEASSVDLGEEFTGLIRTQRAYSASTKIITTADEMLDELIRIKR